MYKNVWCTCIIVLRIKALFTRIRFHLKTQLFFTDDFCPYVSDLEAAEHYQVTFAAGVKRRKVRSPFSLTLLLPWFWHFKLFLRLWRTSQQYKPTPKKFKDGANLLFRGLIIANMYALSMYRWVSYRCQSDSSYSYVWTGKNDAKTPRVYANFLKTEKKSCGLKRRIRIRVDSTLMATPSEVKKFDFFDNSVSKNSAQIQNLTSWHCTGVNLVDCSVSCIEQNSKRALL